MCDKDQKTKTAFAEFWEQAGKTQSHLLFRASLAYSEDNPLTDYYGHIRMCWLFPARHAGPIVSTILRASEQRIYTFEKGWNDLKPIIQDVQYVRGETSNPFDFNSVDERGIAQGVVFVEYHMTAPEDLPGENYFLYWHRGQGWFPISEKEKPTS
ncbi:hypothetical protein IAD21_00250 [Abditibacteriota bacterium]|nr:hypothetical protein IAD21_00250 [Abditibacteriota bacterium]